jgi:hypothetical protein
MFAEMVALGRLSLCADQSPRPPFVMAWRGEEKREEGRSTGKFRFIADARPVNEATKARPFKYPSLGDVGMHFQPGHYAVAQDLKSFFFLMPLHQRHQQFFVVQSPRARDDTFGILTPPPLHPSTGEPMYEPGRYYHYRCLAQGWNLSPFVMNKAVQFLIRRLQRRPGITVVWYVDDVLLVGPKAAVIAALAEFLTLMADLGMTVHPTKGWKRPLQRFVYLGIGVDISRQIWFVPDYKMVVLAERAARTRQHALSHRRFVPARALARVAGTAISLRLASPAILHWCRALFDCLRQTSTPSFDPRRMWRQDCRLTRQALRDLQQLEHLPLLWSWAPFRSGAPDIQMMTDASTRGYGGHLGGQTSTDWVTGYWMDQHVSGDINTLELEAARRTLVAFVNRIRGLRVRLYTDNMSVLAIFNRHASRSARMMQAYRPIFEFLSQNRIAVSARHVATADNVLADDLSRLGDHQEFGIANSLLQLAVSRWHRQPTIDLFASDEYHQPGMPYSTRWASVGGAHDAFLQPWTGMLWLTPPLTMINWVVARLAETSAAAYLLHPTWPGQPYWGSLVALRSDYIEIADISQYVLPNPNNPSIPEVLRDPRWTFQLSLIVGNADCDPALSN